jgi:hypothetical protein
MLGVRPAVLSLLSTMTVTHRDSIIAVGGDEPALDAGSSLNFIPITPWKNRIPSVVVTGNEGIDDSPALPTSNNRVTLSTCFKEALHGQADAHFH